MSSNAWDKRPRGAGAGALTKRERQVFEYAIRGYGNREMAEKLRISIKTIETHRARINRICNVHTPHGLVLYAVREGILTLDNLDRLPMDPQLDLFEKKDAAA
jgi:DNA-binding CsgD family transcriptional regulator